MTKRLTRNNKVNFCFHDEASNMVYYKLQDLEDIMEKYGIDSVEELDDLIANYRTSPILTEEMIKEIAENEIRKTFQKNIQKIRETEYRVLLNELNTWQKACELASETLKQVMGKPLWIGGNIPTPEVKDTDYFYQQAKKEGENETKNENNKSGN